MSDPVHNAYVTKTQLTTHQTSKIQKQYNTVQCNDINTNQHRIGVRTFPTHILVQSIHNQNDINSSTEYNISCNRKDLSSFYKDLSYPIFLSSLAPCRVWFPYSSRFSWMGLYCKIEDTDCIFFMYCSYELVHSAPVNLFMF